VIRIAKINDKEIECPKCHKMIKPKIELNRVKIEFIGSRYIGKDKACLKVCPYCKYVIGTK